MNIVVEFLGSRSSPVPLPDLYFDSLSYPVAPVTSSAGDIVKFIYLLFAEPISNSVLN